MICVYRFSGLIASVGLILYAFVTFLIFYLIEGVLTLPGIAAILLGIGMAVDANVIIFERIKENLRIGKSLDVAYDIGNKTSISSIIDLSSIHSFKNDSGEELASAFDAKYTYIKTTYLNIVL